MVQTKITKQDVLNVVLHMGFVAVEAEIISPGILIAAERELPTYLRACDAKLLHSSVEFENLADFNRVARFRGAALGPFDELFFRVSLDKPIAAKNFLGFDEGPVG